DRLGEDVSHRSAAKDPGEIVRQAPLEVDEPEEREDEDDHEALEPANRLAPEGAIQAIHDLELAPCGDRLAASAVEVLRARAESPAELWRKRAASTELDPPAAEDVSERIDSRDGQIEHTPPARSGIGLAF